MLSESRFQRLPLFIRQPIDNRHDGGFLAGSVCLASIRCHCLLILALQFIRSLGFAGLSLLLGEEGGLRSPVLLNGLPEPSSGVGDLLLALQSADKVAGGPFHKFGLMSLDDEAGGFLGHAVGRQTGDEAGKAGIVAEWIRGIGTVVLGNAKAQGHHLAALLDLLVFEGNVGLGVDFAPCHVHHANAQILIKAVVVWPNAAISAQIGDGDEPPADALVLLQQLINADGIGAFHADGVFQRHGGEILFDVQQIRHEGWRKADFHHSLIPLVLG